MKRHTLRGIIESEVLKNPIRENLDKLENTLVSENELKFYFILDRYIYYNVNEDTGKKEKIFDSGYYTKEYDLKFNSKTNDFYTVLKKKAVKLSSLHNLILCDFLPFTCIGIGNKFRLSFPASRISEPNNDFILYDSKDKWGYLQNDFDLLYEKIFEKKDIENVLVWYTFGKLSFMNMDRFMHYYRCFEELARLYHKSATDSLKKFADQQFPTFSDEQKDRILKIPTSYLVESYLKSGGIDSKIVSQVSEVRNKKIAHGNEYEIEYKYSLKELTDEMESIIDEIIFQQIKEMDINALKNPKFCRRYELLINTNERKIALVYHDSDPIFKLNKWNLVTDFGQGIFDKENLCKKISEKLTRESISINESIIKEISENPRTIKKY